MEEILIETEHVLAQGRMDLPLSLCFAASRGDDLLLQQLLRRGSDPNELDNNGRTALVCRVFLRPFFFSFYFLKSFIYFLQDHLILLYYLRLYVIAYSGIKRKQTLCGSTFGVWSRS